MRDQLFVKGKSGNPRGRPPGPSLVTVEAKGLFQKFIQVNEKALQEDWERIREKQPDKALEIFMKVAEYVYPKLSRSVDKEGNDVKYEFIIRKVE